MTEGFYKTDTYKTSNDDTWTTPRAFFERYNCRWERSGITLIPELETTSNEFDLMRNAMPVPHYYEPHL